MGRIRGGTLSMGGAIAGMGNVDFKDAHEVNRDPADDSLTGSPVVVQKKGSGSIKLQTGSILAGYASADLVVTRKDVSVAAGAETVTTKTTTFKDVYFQGGATIPAGAVGSLDIGFDYGERVES